MDSSVSSATFGLPNPNFTKWFDETEPPYIPKAQNIPLKPLKNPEIPILPSYKEAPEASFWEKFPSCPLPDYSERLTEVDVDTFNMYYAEVWPHLNDEQRDNFESVDHSLRYG